MAFGVCGRHNMHCNKFFISIFILLVSFPPLNPCTQSLSDMLPKSSLSKGVNVSSTSLLHNDIAPTMLWMLDVGCIKASASTHLCVYELFVVEDLGPSGPRLTVEHNAPRSNHVCVGVENLLDLGWQHEIIMWMLHHAWKVSQQKFWFVPFVCGFPNVIHAVLHPIALHQNNGCSQFLWSINVCASRRQHSGFDPILPRSRNLAHTV